MPPALRVENLSKCYQIDHETRLIHYKTLRESLTDLARVPLSGFRQKPRRQTEPFWALKDVNFEVQPGEVVGIIGRNGAGKSTLLKILSRITKPTTGEVALYGRVGSLLEVGTGFHAELTGRENIYLNGSILGMTRPEIDRCFDQITAFARIDRFLDTPVKRYSSGMYVRLAFAVAAHLETDILLVDEVLAVGDAVFQRRCLERMTELARSGRALLFVSHNLDLIPKFCQRAILLEAGSVKLSGGVHDVLAEYLKDLRNGADAGDLRRKQRRGTGKARFTSLKFLDEAGDEISVLHSGEDLRCLLEIEASCPIEDVSLAVVINTLQGTRIVSSLTEEVGYAVDLKPGRQLIECRFEKLRIRPGRQVSVEIWMHDGGIVDHIEDVCVLDVIERQTSGYSHRQDQGVVLCDYRWIRHETDASSLEPQLTGS